MFKSSFTNKDIYINTIINDMEIWNNRTLEEIATFIVHKHEVNSLLSHIRMLVNTVEQLENQIVFLKEGLKNEKTDS